MNPARDWFDSLAPWDRVPRLADLPRTWLRTPREHQATASRVVSRWLVDCVRRAYAPGCEVGPALALAGPQGCGKSWGLRTLAGPLYASAEGVSDLDDRHRAESLHYAAGGAAIVEIAAVECDRWWRGFVASRVDIFRPKYTNDTRKVERAFVLCMTTNDPRADLGSECAVVLCDRVAHLADATRSQVWAEAIARAEVRHA